MSEDSPAAKDSLLILGDQLFPDLKDHFPPEEFQIIMLEDFGLCRHFKYHKHKLIFFLASMRRWAEERRTEGYTVLYRELSLATKNQGFFEGLSDILKESASNDTLHGYEIDDAFFEQELMKFARRSDLSLELHTTKKFLFSREDFENYLSEKKKPFLKTYYERQRKALKVLVASNGEPFGGKWSFDEDNRKKLPANHKGPLPLSFNRSREQVEVSKVVDELFNDHPGNSETFNWATNRSEALIVLEQFLNEKFDNFGPYEDAFEAQEVFLYHSTLSPYLNIGLLTPEEVLKACLNHFEKHDTHYPSVEGFVRQLMGWREFIRGMDRNFDFSGNHFGFHRKLKSCWYEGKTGIPPLDDSIKKANKTAYTHHIERLMVIGNIMLMTELDPQEVYRWFMEMYIDSADWVMAPNVLGMSQFADGGIFATKPYIAGSNYMRKMSHYPKGDWCDIVDGLYWRFIDRQRETFAKNHRMGMMLATLNKMNPERKEHIFKAAENWIEKVSFTG